MAVTFERSSGYAGYRCNICGGWMYAQELDDHVCPKPLPKMITIPLEEYERLRHIKSDNKSGEDKHDY